MRRWSRSTRIVVLFVLALLLASYARFAIVEPIVNWDASDLAINYSAAVVLREGGSIYDSPALRQAHEAHIGPAGTLYQATFLTYINPPTTALFFWPFSFLTFSAAQTVFVILNNAAFLLAIGWLLFRLQASQVMVVVCVIICTQIFFYPIRETFGLGQMNGLLVLMFVAAIVAALDGRDVLAGTLIVLAAAFKICPILLLGFFIVQKRPRVWIGAVISGLIIFVFMIVTVGWDTIMYFLVLILPIVSRGSASYPNQSLLGAIYRLTIPAESINFQSAMADYPSARLLWLVLSVVLLLVTFYLIRRSKLRTPASTAVALSSLIVLALLINGLAWDHYLVWLVVPVIALIADWANSRWLRPVAFYAVLAIDVLAINIPTPIEANWYTTLGPIASSISTCGIIVLLILCWWRLGSTRWVETTSLGV